MRAWAATALALVMGMSALVTAPAASAAPAPVVTAKSCARTDVQKALTAAKDGSIVQIPAGVCDWGAAPAVTRPAGVWLRGAGKGKTVIKRGAPVVPLPYQGKACTAALSYDARGSLRLAPCLGNPPPSAFLIEFDCANGKRVEVSDLTLEGNDPQQTELQRLIDGDNGLGLRGGCTDFKIHDAAFNRFSTAGVTIRDGGRGVIYRNQFLSDFKCQDSGTVLPRAGGGKWKVTEPLACLGYGVAVYGDGTWPETVTLGGPDAVFIEENYFYDNRHAVASNLGSRYVVRLNKIAHSERARNFGIVDAHGQGGYGVGSRSWEIYRNTLVDRTTTQSGTTGILVRGGDGVVWGNAIPATFSWAMAVTTEGGCTAATYPLPGQTRQAYTWGNHLPGKTVLAQGMPASYSYNPACVRIGRDVVESAKPGYTPYPFPHPLRAQALF